MPLIIITGVPCSGKSIRTQELKKHFEAEGKEVLIVSEEDELKKAGFTKNVLFQGKNSLNNIVSKILFSSFYYLDSYKEKQIRGSLKSKVMQLIGPNNLVILDASNYIKGEIFFS